MNEDNAATVSSVASIAEVLDSYGCVVLDTADDPTASYYSPSTETRLRHRALSEVEALLAGV